MLRWLSGHLLVNDSPGRPGLAAARRVGLTLLGQFV